MRRYLVTNAPGACRCQDGGQIQTRHSLHDPHLSRLSTGANLYFIFIAKIDTIREYLDLQYSILEAIAQSGASISHHHGVGKQTAPWLEDQIGKEQMDLIRLLKNHFDPNNIMNPGGTLGLDMNEAQKAKVWSKDLEA